MTTKRTYAWKIFPANTDIQMGKAITIKKKEKPLMVFKRLQDAVRQAGLANLNNAKIAYGYIENRLEDDWHSKSLNGMWTRKYMVAWMEMPDKIVGMMLEQIASEMMPYVVPGAPECVDKILRNLRNPKWKAYEGLKILEIKAAATQDKELDYQENTENWCAIRAVKHTCNKEYNLYRSLYEAIHFASITRNYADPKKERERYERIILSALWEWEWDRRNK